MTFEPKWQLEYNLPVTIEKLLWLIFSFVFLCCLSSHMSWFAWMKLILGPLVLEAYKFKLKWVISRVGLSEVCRSPDAKSCHSHLPLCPRMASCRGSNLSETLRCPDIAHNRLNLRLPITAQILSSSKVHRGHPGILLLTASSSTICICQSLKILEELNYEYFTLLQYAKSGWKYPFCQNNQRRKLSTSGKIFAKNNNPGALQCPC